MQGLSVAPRRYRWGKFQGGLMLVLGLPAFLAAPFIKSRMAYLVGLVFCSTGFGLLAKKTFGLYLVFGFCILLTFASIGESGPILLLHLTVLLFFAIPCALYYPKRLKEFSRGSGAPVEPKSTETSSREGTEPHLADEQFNLGALYLSGKGVQQDDAKGAALLIKAAEQGHLLAQMSLADLYSCGQGVPQDYKQAAVWYRKAAEQGDPEAQSNLGCLYQRGQGVRQDNVQSVAWFRKAADQGFAFAQHNLANQYFQGQGVPQDCAQAAVWYRRAAERGHPESQSNLGCLYQHGQGVPKDYAQAGGWFRKAADQGYVIAQFNLASFYRYGQGVPKDDAQAAFWFRKAAEQGDSDAQYHLGFQYLFGWGVPENKVEAYFWLELAASGEPGTIKRGEVIRDRELAASNLAKPIVMQTQERARKWPTEHQRT